MKQIPAATIVERVEQIKAIFADLPSWEDKYKKIITLGKELPAMESRLKIEANLVKGCQSQVWLVASLSPEKKVLFVADSDALITKGLIALLLFVYSNSYALEIMQHSPEFIKDLGFSSHLSPNRANGFYSMVRQIKNYAIAYSLKP